MTKNTYLDRYALESLGLQEAPNPHTHLIVVIPCYNEPDLFSTLDSIYRNVVDTSFKTEVLVVINHSEDSTDAIIANSHKTNLLAEKWLQHNSHKHISFHFVVITLKKKHAGVGLARKYGMDEAVRRFENINREDGVIVCLDADCTVDRNYLQAIHDHFKTNVNCEAASIYFEHPLEEENQEGICYYELFLRYYAHALKYARYPFSFQTVGSAMAVRHSCYQKHGGMNRRKAGEDFYFIHKIAPHVQYLTITNTTVHPSPRSSDRVPFGTGAAIGKWLEHQTDLTTSYDFQIFELLRTLIAKVSCYYEDSERDICQHLSNEQLKHYCLHIGLEEELARIRENTTNASSFKKSFYQWFDGLQVLKMVHFLRDNYFPNTSLVENVNTLFASTGEKRFLTDAADQLNHLRDVDRLG